MTRFLIPFALVLLAGCHEPGRSVPQTPSDAVRAAVALSVGDFVDTHQNGCGDSRNITAYVYSSRYPIPLAARGAFEFELQTTKGDVLTRWTFDEAQTAAARREMAPGPGFVFNLSMVGSDATETTEAEIVCTFRPAGRGEPVRARPSAPIAIGPVNRRSGGR